MLSSIGGNGPPKSPQNQHGRLQHSQNGLGAPLQQDSKSSEETVIVPSHKRGADNILDGPGNKFVRMGNDDGSSPGVTSRKHARTTGAKVSPVIATSSPKPSTPNRRMNDANSASTISSTQAHNTSTQPKKEPKKGSYAEIMARAKANQAKPQAVGTISHKPKDKMPLSYKQELKMKRQASKGKRLGIKEASRPGSSDSRNSSAALEYAGSQKSAQSGYTGTTKLKSQSTYKGTMMPASLANKKATSRERECGSARSSKYRPNQYAGTDDELDDDEDGEDEKDGSGYGSEELGDMEAGFSDVEQEESAAAQAARREDQEEAILEAKLKREKEERRRRLEAMAKKAKPQRY